MTDQKLEHRGILRRARVVKVTQVQDESTVVHLKTECGEEFHWMMQYRPEWRVGRHVEMIVDVMDHDTRMGKNR